MKDIVTREIPKYADAESASAHLTRLGDDFALIRNPPGTYPPYEVCPLVPKRSQLTDGLDAVLLDMDGTLSSTESLVVEALESTIRYLTGRATDSTWQGLDAQRDYPHIVGNSNSQNLVYLLRAYGQGIDRGNVPKFVLDLAGDAGARLDLADVPSIIETAIGIYAFFYGKLLGLPRPMSAQRVITDAVLDELRTMSEARPAADSLKLVKPMPGAGIFMALAGGYLGEEAARLTERLVALLPQHGDGFTVQPDLARLGAYFENCPARLALVTSSTRQEVDLILGRVMQSIVEELSEWGISEERRERFASHLLDTPDSVFCRCITADDSHEIRLKPYRDLYSVALYELGIGAESAHKVLALEDSEAGVVSVRAAGIPLCCAVPHDATQGHDFSAASHVCRGGLAEVILRHGLFLSDAP